MTHSILLAATLVLLLDFPAHITQSTFNTGPPDVVYNVDLSHGILPLPNPVKVHHDPLATRVRVTVHLNYGWGLMEESLDQAASNFDEVNNPTDSMYTSWMEGFVFTTIGIHQVSKLSGVRGFAERKYDSILDFKGTSGFRQMCWEYEPVTFEIDSTLIHNSTYVIPVNHSWHINWGIDGTNYFFGAWLVMGDLSYTVEVWH